MMPCGLPPEPNDQELLAYLDGEADSQIEEHVARCPHCRERARQLARLQGQLTARLYRAVCPTTVELGEYHLGLLAGERAAAVARHLAECPHCARETGQLREYLDALAPSAEPTPLEQVQVLVARLVRHIAGSIQPAPALAPAYALRGEEAGPLLYQAGDVQVSITVEADAARPGRRLLLGFVIGMATADLEACLSQEDRPVATVPVDELGNLAVPDLAPGTYHLILRGPTIEVHIPELEVG
jgi:anti-sigma factor RsiW